MNMRLSTSSIASLRREEPADLAHVSLASDGEICHWMNYFGTTETRLHEAVSLMGTEVARVRAYLRRFR